MFRVRMVREFQKDRVVFRVGRLFRVVNAATALLLLVAGYALGAFVVPMILATLAVLGALYEESVVFDRGSRTARFRVGLVFLSRSTLVGLESIAEVRISTFDPARFSGFEIGLHDGRVLTVENDRGKTSSERLSLWAQDLAAWLGLPLVERS